ncbi:MAG: cation transporting ATPase C-terminal domain-containing protein [Oscillospiraceae bacterium]|nr:cation transporting ATPase C-terminal domain-containing protein [Oscillospiraceae bacterium]
MAEKKINWSGKTVRDLEIYFSTDIKKGLSRANYADQIEKYGENIINPNTPETRNFYGLEKKTFDLRAVFSRSAGIFGCVYIISAVSLSLLGFEVNVFFLVPAYMFLTLSVVMLFLISEYNYSNLYKAARPRILVMRRGAKEKVFAESIVPGDVIMLKKGDIVPADAKIVKSNNLSCLHKLKIPDGEENIRQDKTHITEKNVSHTYEFEPDILYASDIIESGVCTAVVFATGPEVLIAKKYKYAGQPKQAGSPRPVSGQPGGAQPPQTSDIQNKAAKASKTLFLLSVAAAGLFILFGMFSGRELTLAVLTCLTASAAAYSEQLTVPVDFALTYGMKKSALLGAAVKKISDIDKLNKINMLIMKKNDICPRDRLRLEKIYFADEDFDVSYENRLDLDYILLSAAAVCDADNLAVAKAVFEAADNLKLNYKEYKKLGEVVYADRIKSAPILHSKNIVLVCLGEGDDIIGRCTRQLSGSGIFEPVNMPALEKKLVELYNTYDLVMAVALKELTGTAGNLNTEVSNLDFWAFAVFSEERTPEARENITALKKFGMIPIMVMNSSGVYTYKTALNFGIVTPNDDFSDAVVNNSNINSIHTADLNKIRVIERLSQKNNILLLKALNSRGKYAAVTASGISEAELLNESYLSFCHNDIKDEVLKNKSGVNIKNMSLSLILKSVKTANIINKNAQNIIIFSAALFIAQYLLIFFATVLRGAYILNPAQIIWAAAGAGFFCAAAIASNSEDLNKIKKRRPSENDNRYFKTIRNQSIITGLIIFLSVLITYFLCSAVQENNISGYINSPEAVNPVQTAAFLTYITGCFAVSARYIKNFFKNKIFMTALILNTAAVSAAVTLEPVREYLEFGQINFSNIRIVAIIGIIQILIFMVMGKFKYKRREKL